MRKGVQLYKCMVCGHQFRGKVYLERSVVWEAYTEEKQTICDLSRRYKVSESTIKRLLKDVSVDWKNPKVEGHGIVNIDATSSAFTLSFRGNGKAILVYVVSKVGACIGISFYLLYEGKDILFQRQVFLSQSLQLSIEGWICDEIIFH